MFGVIGCERSGVIREAFRRRGHDVWSCDLADAEDGSQHHYKRDIFQLLDEVGDRLDFFMVHPECTYLCSSGLHWNKRRPERAAKTDAALAFVEGLMKWAQLKNATAKQSGRLFGFALENPRGCINTRLSELAYQFDQQAFQPHQFGDDASKETVLHLLNLPKLNGTKSVPPRWVCGCGHTYREPNDKYGCANCAAEHGPAKARWANQTDSGQNRLGPSAERWMERSRTYQGPADAMAHQWGRLWEKSFD